MDNSLWIEDTKNIRKDYEKLNSNINTEICVIGGGLTGLTTAYYLSKAGKKVVSLEKYKIGSHTSGNTTAKITSQHGLFYKYLVDSLGVEQAKEYLYANEDAIKNIEKIINEENIQCDFERQDAYVFTQDIKELEKIEDEVDVVNKLGLKAEFVEKIEIPKEILGAIKFPNQAQFNPVKYMLGLSHSIEKYGGTIYENTKVVDVKKQGDEYLTITEDGQEVKSRYVVLASHYPFINAPGFYFMKMYQVTSYLIAVDTASDLFDGMYINSENPTKSFRTAEYQGKRLLIVGGMDHKTGAKIDLSNSYKNLEKVAKEMYPNSKVLFRWNTEDCIPLDKIPYIGEFSTLMPNMYVATGYKKWGMTSSNVAANIISNRILGEENKYEKVFESTRLKPIKNYEELGNIVKEVSYSLIINKLKKSKDILEDVKKDEGRIVELEDTKVGVYKDKNGKLFAIKPVCTHLGCELSWNNLDKTWDCPCHGSRFDYTGKSLYDPSIKDLEKYEI